MILFPLTWPHGDAGGISFLVSQPRKDCESTSNCIEMPPFNLQ